jgi:hypothetical protein
MVCAPCTATALRARRWTLERLRGAHERARADLASALSRGETMRKKRIAEVEIKRARLEERRSRLAALRKSVERARVDNATRAALNASRAAALREASKLLTQRRAALFSLAGLYPETRRALALRLKTAEDAFAKEACFALASLKALVPVAAERPDPETGLRRVLSCRRDRPTSRGQSSRATAAFSQRRTFVREDGATGDLHVNLSLEGDGTPTAVRVCGFRAPDPGDLAEFRAEELSAGLGALLLFTETCSKIIGAARVARGDRAGSSNARVWVPDSYFETTRDDALKLPLFLPQRVVEANGGGPGAFDARENKEKAKATKKEKLGALVYGTVEKVTSTSATAAAQVLANTFVASAGLNTHTPTRAPPPDPGDPAVLARHRAELHRALATLHRHAGATCVELERVLGLGIRAPKKWGPFASLAFLVTEASRRARDARDAEREERVRQRSLESKAPPAHERNPFRDDDDDAFDDDADYDGGFGSAPNGSEPRAKTTGRSLMTSVFGGAAVHGKRFQKHFRARVTRARETTTGDSDDAEERRGGETTCERIAFGAASVAELAELGWDLVEHPARAASRRQSSQSGEKDATAPAMLPPPPSAPEDVEHWTRAMYVDARR